QRFLGEVVFKDGYSVFAVRQVDIDPAVKTAGAEQGRVEHVGTVGSGQNYDVLPLFEAVHFNQNLVKRLLALVVAAPHAAASAAANSVDFVNENYAGRVLF